LHGFVADYDAKRLDGVAVYREIADARDAGFPPSAGSRTFHGGLRVLWALDSRVPVSSGEIAQGILRRAITEMRLKKLSPAFDDGGFLDRSRYRELGDEWRIL